MRKIAIFSDVHGNALALRAVLADIEGKGITEVYNLGDSFYGPLWPRECFEILLKRNLLGLKGNQDRMIYEMQGDLNHTQQFVLGELSDVLGNIKALPFDYLDDDLFLFHASPKKDDEYFIEIIELNHSKKRVGEDLLKDIPSHIKAPIIAFGHSHVPQYIQTENRHFINVGSVGLPAYTDDLPYMHKMEAGSPHARYAIITIGDDITVEMQKVIYDWEAAAKQVQSLGRNDWAKALATGKVE